MITKKTSGAFPFFSLKTDLEKNALSKKHKTIEAATLAALQHHRKTNEPVIAGNRTTGSFSIFSKVIGANNSILKIAVDAGILAQELGVDCYYAYCKTDQKRLVKTKSNSFQEAQDKADDHYTSTGHDTTVETVYRH